MDVIKTKRPGRRRYLVGYLDAYLVGHHGLAEGIEQCAEHELDKRGDVCLLIDKLDESSDVGRYLLVPYKGD